MGIGQRVSANLEPVDGNVQSTGPDGEIALLAIEAIALREKSAAAMRGIPKHVSCLVRFYLDIRDDTKAELTGEQSVALLRDYLESLDERGRTAPSSAKHALSVWADALGIYWPLSRALVCSDAIVESDENSKKAPEMSLSTLRAIEEMAASKLTSPHKRAFASGIRLVTYGILRFPDVRRIRPFGADEDSVRGTIRACKTTKQNGQFWPWAFPREGMTGTRDWVQPFLDMRQPYRKRNGDGPPFAFMRADQTWEPVASDAAPYSATRRKLAIMCSIRRP